MNRGTNLIRPCAACAAALVFALTASAADLPKPLAEADRAAVVAKWRKAFDAKRAELQNQYDEAAAVLKQLPTNADARAAQQQANTQLAAMKKAPLSFAGDVFKPIGRTDDTARGRAKAGQIGPLARPAGLVSDALADGTLFEVIHEAEFGEEGGPKLTRYLLVGGVPKAKKGAKVAVAGLWYYAGDTEHAGKKVAVLHPFEVKKDELPTFDVKK